MPQVGRRLTKDRAAPMLAHGLSYSILMSVPFHENHLLGFWTDDWIIHGLKVKHGMGRWFFIEKKGHVG